jgi:hypothetical protein
MRIFRSEPGHGRAYNRAICGRARDLIVGQPARPGDQNRRDQTPLLIILSLGEEIIQINSLLSRLEDDHRTKC